MKCEFIFKDDARKILGCEENDVNLTAPDIAKISDTFIETEILEKVCEFDHREPEKVTYRGWVNEKYYDSKTKEYKTRTRHKESSFYFPGATKYADLPMTFINQVSKCNLKFVNLQAAKF